MYYTDVNRIGLLHVKQWFNNIVQIDIVKSAVIYMFTIR